MLCKSRQICTNVKIVTTNGNIIELTHRNYISKPTAKHNQTGGVIVADQDDFIRYYEFFERDTKSPANSKAIINLGYAITYALRIDPEKTSWVIALAKEWSINLSGSGHADIVSSAGQYLPNEIDRTKPNLKGQMIAYADWYAYAFLVMGNAGSAKMKNDYDMYLRAIKSGKELDNRMPLIKLEKWVRDIWEA